ncbi:MAG: HNH endonuclease [Tidjanibacter sp.]|nr:HNH endonuclease [Tidjanibacter sp.]
MIRVDEYIVEKTCYYGEEFYSVRDNGAVMRHRKDGRRKRPLDETWTFGKPDEKAYLKIAGAPIHRIVATAFHGNPRFEDMVVDHIDTNRHNNRPENLRWQTRLENVLNNPITLKKIKYVCGSVESFLQNPHQMKEHFQDFAWMHRMSPEEAEYSYKSWLYYVNKEPSTQQHTRVVSEEKPLINDNDSRYSVDADEYVSMVNNRMANADSTCAKLEWADDYKVSPYEEDLKRQKEREERERLEYEKLKEEERQYLMTLSHDEKVELGLAKPDVESKNNPLAMQRDWNTPSDFKMCPLQMGDNPILEYAKSIRIGELFCSGVYDNYVVDYNVNSNETYLILKSHIVGVGVKYDKEHDCHAFGIMIIHVENGKYIHEVTPVEYHEDEWDEYYKYVVDVYKND